MFIEKCIMIRCQGYVGGLSIFFCASQSVGPSGNVCHKAQFLSTMLKEYQTYLHINTSVYCVISQTFLEYDCHLLSKKQNDRIPCAHHKDCVVLLI